uniref:Aminotransferase-like plant mobile domain-containing protein n=1 Tax=Chenopodium quinoa TaxID=63459 RepID=A0A803LVH3_CHEQI
MDKLAKLREVVLGRMIDPQQQQQLISAFSRIVVEFSFDNVLLEMGFGALLNLKINRLDRKFCYWLLTRVDLNSCLMVFGDGKELPLCPLQWNLVLSIPYGRKTVPLVCDGVDESTQGRIRAIGGWFRMVDASGRTHLPVGEVEKVFVSKLDKTKGKLRTEEDVVHFKSAYLVVLGQLLCPTTNGGNLSISLLLAVSVAAKAENYNWCSFAFDWLMSYVSKFKGKFDKYNFVSGCGGCTIFLMMFYIDHLSLTPYYWNETPRINVWTQSDVMGVIEADRKASRIMGS